MIWHLTFAVVLSRLHEYLSYSQKYGKLLQAKQALDLLHGNRGETLPDKAIENPCTYETLKEPSAVFCEEREFPNSLTGF